MRRKRPGRWAGLLVVAGSTLGVLAGEAEAPTSRDVYGKDRRAIFCLFVSGPACVHSLSIDGVFAYQRSFDETTRDKDFFRMSGEVGYHLRLGRTAMQVGSAFEAGGVFNDDGDGWFLIPKLRVRMWPGYSPVGIELSPGFVLDGQRDEVTRVPIQRMGAHGEPGVTFYGAFTLFGAGQWLRSEEGVTAANAIVGARILLPVALEILAASRR